MRFSTPTHENTAPTLATLLDQPLNHLDNLRTKLSDTAKQSGLLDISYRIIQTPVGKLLLAATKHGLARVAYEQENFDTVLETLAAAVGPRVIEAPQHLATTAQELTEYFAGSRRNFNIPLDYSLSTGFRQTVQRYLPHIEYGHTQSYRQVAQAVESPKAARAVGTACATNPLPVIVPCHRVLRSDGHLGGYIGGLEAKETLLALERQQSALNPE